MSVDRHHFWLGSPGGAVAACLHLPRDHRVRPHPVVICPPFGYEYTHSHRSLLHLADDLAGAGFAAIRIDYVGTGDSEGDASASELLARWIGSIDSASQAVTRLTGGGLPTLLGLRFGALLAGVAASRTDVRNMVAWHAVTSGRRYIREYQALQSLGADASAADTGRIEAGGFVLAAETADAVRDLDLGSLEYRLRGRALIVERDDLKPDDRLAERLRALGIATQVTVAPGYLGMMAEPQYTVVPQQAIDTTVSWLAEQDRDERVVVDPAALDHLIGMRSVAWREGGVPITEEHARIPVDGTEILRGILTRPGHSNDAVGTIVMLANSGSVHHVGPNRLYVELARALARAGVASLRLDLRNLGDSRLGPHPNENHPYPATAIDDVRAALDWLVGERGFAQCVVAGLCSGAHTAFHAGLDIESSISGVICVNPLTFQWHEGMSLDTPDSHRTTRDAQYYKRAVRSWAKWKKLLLGQANVGYIVRFSLLRVRDVVRRRFQDAAEWARLRAPGPLGQGLERYRASGMPLHFVFSTNDPGYAILMSEARLSVERLRSRGAIKIDFVDQADHTFSRESWRSRAAEAVAEAVRAIAAPTSI